MEAPDSTSNLCQECHQKTGFWHCKQCFGGRVLCGLCCRNAHMWLPYHRVERWNGKYFRVGALWEVGVKLHLGHQGRPCP
ncbi:hypothetical protein GALMADRAFT_63361, partial [Galerina marginata CBS 339.88]